MPYVPVPMPVPIMVPVPMSLYKELVVQGTGATAPVAPLQPFATARAGGRPIRHSIMPAAAATAHHHRMMDPSYMMML